MATISRRPKLRNIQDKQNGRYARLNKNIMHSGELGRLIHEGFTGPELHVLIALLAEAQRRGKHTLIFKSDYALLKFLGWGDRTKDYVVLDKALVKWAKARLEFQDFYEPRKARRRFTVVNGFDVSTSRAKEMRKERGEPELETRVFDWKYIKGKQVKITFDRSFWDIHKAKKGFFAQVNPHHLKALHYPTEMALYIYVETWRSKINGKLREEHNINFKKLAPLLGLELTHRKRFGMRLTKAIKRINKVAKDHYRCRVYPDGIVCFDKEPSWTPSLELIEGGKGA